MKDYFLFVTILHVVRHTVPNYYNVVPLRLQPQCEKCEESNGGGEGVDDCGTVWALNSG